MLGGNPDVRRSVPTPPLLRPQPKVRERTLGRRRAACQKKKKCVLYIYITVVRTHMRVPPGHSSGRIFDSGTNSHRIQILRAFTVVLVWAVGLATAGLPVTDSTTARFEGIVCAGSGHRATPGNGFQPRWVSTRMKRADQGSKYIFSVGLIENNEVSNTQKQSHSRDELGT